MMSSMVKVSKYICRSHIKYSKALARNGNQASELGLADFKIAKRKLFRLKTVKYDLCKSFSSSLRFMKVVKV